MALQVHRSVNGPKQCFGPMWVMWGNVTCWLRLHATFQLGGGCLALSITSTSVAGVFRSTTHHQPPINLPPGNPNHAVRSLSFTLFTGHIHLHQLHVSEYVQRLSLTCLILPLLAQTDLPHQEGPLPAVEPTE